MSFTQLARIHILIRFESEQRIFASDLYPLAKKNGFTRAAADSSLRMLEKCGFLVRGEKQGARYAYQLGDADAGVHPYIDDDARIKKQNRCAKLLMAALDAMTRRRIGMMA